MKTLGDTIVERICGKVFGHRYEARELRFHAVLNTYGKTYDICSMCGKRRFLGWQRSLDDKEFASLEDDGIPWNEVHP